MQSQRVITILLVATCTVSVQAIPITIVDNEPGMFVDIAGTGQVLALSGDLETRITTTIGNAVFPGGDIVVANNGGLGFGDPSNDDLDPLNLEIPSVSAFGGGQSLLGFWDDIGNTVGAVYWEELPDRLIVQYDNKQFEDSTDTLRFQMQIFDFVGNRASVYAQIIFADIEQPRAGGGISATIGYQDGGAGNNDVQWSFNTAGAVMNGTVLSLVPVPEPSTGMLVAMAIAAMLRRGR